MGHAGRGAVQTPPGMVPSSSRVFMLKDGTGNFNMAIKQRAATKPAPLLPVVKLLSACPGSPQNLCWKILEGSLWLAGGFGEGIEAAAEWGGRSITTNSRRPQIRH